MSAPSAVSMRSVSYSYNGTAALRGITDDVRGGEFVGIIGPNGAGKSTLLRLINRTLPLREGAITVFGRDLESYSTTALARRVASVQAETTVPYEFSVREIAAMGRSPHLSSWKRPSGDDDAIVDEALETADITRFSSRPIQSLSSGERQRAFIAQALVQRPSLLLLDEPTAHLDLNHQVEIMRMLTRLNRHAGLTIMLVSHDIILAAEFCSRIILMDNGAIQAAGIPGEVITAERLSAVYGIRIGVRRNKGGRMKRTTPVVCAVCLCAAISCARAVETEDLGTIVVTATRSAQVRADLATNVTVITRADLDRTQPADVAEALADCAFVSIGSNGHLGALQSVSLRGSTAQQVLMLIDGRPVNDLAFGMGIPNQIPIEQVERIEIVRGGGSVLYGANAVGGVINVITRTGAHASPTVDIGYEYGRYETMKYLLRFDMTSGPTTTLLSLSRHLSNGYRENEDFLGEQIFLKLGHDAGRWGRLSLTGSLYDDKLGIPGPNYTPVDQWNDILEKVASSPDSSQDDRREYGMLEHEAALAAGVSVRTRIYGSVDERTDSYVFPSWDAVAQNLTKGIDVQATLPAGIVAGVDVRQDRYFQKMKLSNAQLSSKRATSRAAYLQMIAPLMGGALRVTPGVRFENHSAYSRQTNPKATVVYQALPWLKLSASGGRSFRAPTFNELIYSPSIEPETAHSYDAGAAVSLGSSMDAEATVYRMDFKELIVWAPDNSGSWVPANAAGTTRSEGAEVSLIHRPAPWFTHTVSYAYNTTRDQSTDKVLFYRPAHRARYAISAESSKGAGVDVGITGVGRQFVDSAMESALPGYALVDIRFRKRILAAELYAGYANAGNTRYLTRLGYPLAGMTYYAGITVRFTD